MSPFLPSISSLLCVSTVIMARTLLLVATALLAAAGHVRAVDLPKLCGTLPTPPPKCDVAADGGKCDPNVLRFAFEGVPTEDQDGYCYSTNPEAYWRITDEGMAFAVSASMHHAS